LRIKLSGILFHDSLSRKWNDASGMIVKNKVELSKCDLSQPLGDFIGSDLSKKIRVHLCLSAADTQNPGNYTNLAIIHMNLLRRINFNLWYFQASALGSRHFAPELFDFISKHPAGAH